MGRRWLRARRPLAALLLLTLPAAVACQSQAADPAPGSLGSPSESSAEASASSSPSADAEPYVYVAMGDSYTAAQGVPRTDWNDGCQQSERNYPTLVADKLAEVAGVGTVDLVDVSCSGAATLHMERERDAGGAALHPPQYDALSADTDLVSVSVGYNDFRIFHTLFGRCVAMAAKDPQGSPCRDRLVRPNGFDFLDKRVEEVGDRVAEVVRGIRERAPEARILVLSYPHLVPAEGTCSQRLPLATGDYPYVRGVNVHMAKVLEAAADGVEGAEFVDVTSASEGHDACSDDAWVGGVAPLSSRGVAYHPFATEQRVVAKLVLDAVAAS